MQKQTQRIFRSRDLHMQKETQRDTYVGQETYIYKKRHKNEKATQLQ